MENDISERMQELFRKYATFTDSYPKALTIQRTKDDKKHCTVALTIEFQSGAPDAVITFSGVKKMHIEQIQNFGIYELEYKKDGEYYMFDFVGTASDWGELWFLAKGIDVKEA